MISHHHSSVMPEGGKSSSAKITKDEVRALFTLWNDALLTGDSKKVAARYAKEGTLLPTVSDKPRTDFDGIADYFDVFCAKKPSGKILEGTIKIGENWASDVVKARYSYVYVYEDGQWMISHHHSSVMPEGG